jgi:hypothetical protein
MLARLLRRSEKNSALDPQSALLRFDTHRTKYALIIL